MGESKMATTQYIGARYVSLFAEPIEWDKTKQYEPLTIVSSNGNSYTSRQFVPAGIEITNDTFWAMTGNYNAQIEQYRKNHSCADRRHQCADRRHKRTVTGTYKRDQHLLQRRQACRYSRLRIEDAHHQRDESSDYSRGGQRLRNLRRGGSASHGDQRDSSQVPHRNF